MTERFLGRHRLLRQIGRGGMATVYHAIQEGPHGFAQEVAIKLVHPELVASHPHVIQMLVDEARIAARIRHPNVVRILDLCQDGLRFYMVMDYVDGLSLREVLDAARIAGRPAALGPMLDILSAACEGLHAAHRLTRADGSRLDLVHRDVKPGNILISAEGEAKVADFGIAMFEDRLSEATLHGQMKGTPAYMAPEQSLGEKTDHRADIFSMGMTLYTMVTTKLAFTGETATAVALKIAVESMEPHAVELDALAPGLGDVLRLACARDPEARFPTAREMGAALTLVRRGVSDDTTIAELLAAAGWRPWDGKVTTNDFGLPDAPKPARGGSLLELSDQNAAGDPPTDADEPATTADVRGPQDDDEPTDPGVISGRASPTSTPPAPPRSGPPRAPSPLDLEETPPVPHVEVLLPGEGPRPTRPPPSNLPPREAGPRRRTPRTDGPRIAPPPPAHLRPPSLGTPGSERHLQPERDFRGRVVQRKVVPASATRVGTGERLAVVVAGLLVLATVVAVVAFSRRAPDPTRLEGVALEAGEGESVAGAKASSDPANPSSAAPTASTPSPTESSASATATTPSPTESSAPPNTTTPAPTESSTPKPSGTPPAPKPSGATPTPARAPSPTPAPPPAAAPIATHGTLTVNTYPWAQVFVDGQALGRTPLMQHSLPAGSHQLRLVVPAAGDQVIEETVEVIGGRETKIVRRVAAEAPEGDPTE